MRRMFIRGEQPSNVDGEVPAGASITGENRCSDAQIAPVVNRGELGPMQRVSNMSGLSAGDQRSPKSTDERGRSSMATMKYDISKSDEAVADAAVLVYVDDRELVRRTSIGRGTWQKMRFEGRGPTVRKIGRRCLYRWSEVVAWLESHRVDGGAGGAVP